MIGFRFKYFCVESSVIYIFFILVAYHRSWNTAYGKPAFRQEER